MVLILANRQTYKYTPKILIKEFNGKKCLKECNGWSFLFIKSYVCNWHIEYFNKFLKIRK